MVITNVIWSIVVVSVMIYAQNQSSDALEYKLRAAELEAEARLQEEKAIKMATLARQAQAEAERQQQLAQEEREQAVEKLEDCLKGKKR